MAKSPDGKPARVEKVAFTRQAADRIQKVVRSVELGGRDGDAVNQGARLQSVFPPAKVFRICTFTGSWSTSDTKVVTFVNQTNTPNTALARNVFQDIAASGTSQNVAIAKEGTSWYAVEFLPQPFVRMATFTGSWQKDATKTVTFKYAPSGTASATNLFANIASSSGARNCAVAKEGTAWFLIAAQC